MFVTTDSASLALLMPAAGKSWRQYLLPALFFLLLVTALNLPLVMNLGTHVIGRPFDDAFEVLWQLASVKEAVFETHTSPFYTPHIFFPQGWYTASGAQPPWYFVLLAPLTAALGPVATYNLSILSCLVVAALGACWVVHKLTGSLFAGVVAGCAYIGAPVFALHMNGFFNMLIGMMFLPYAVGSAYIAVTHQGARTWLWVLTAGAFLAAAVLGQWYYLFIATLPLLGLVLFVSSEVRVPVRVWRLIAIGGVALLIMAPFALLTLRARRAMLPGGASYPLSMSEQLGFSPDYLLSPNPFHPLWRERLTAVFPVTGERDIVSVGIAAALLAAVGLFVTPWRKTRPFVAMVLISLVLGLGMTLRWRGERVLISAPSGLAEVMEPLVQGLDWPVGQLPIPLPGLLLYHYLPFYSSMRAWARFAIPIILGTAILAGFGTAWLLTRGRKGQFVAATFWVLIVFESLAIPYQYFTPVSANARAVNEWLASLPAGTAIIEYPRPWVDKLAMYSQAAHGLSVVNGYMSFQPAFMAAVDGQLGEWPNAAALPILREWGVDYVVVSTLPEAEVFRDTIWPAITSLDMCLVASFPDAHPFMGFGETHVFRIQEPGAACTAAALP